jgi:CBS domain-containing protein
MQRGRDFGLLAVEERAISRAQLRQAIEEQRRLRKNGHRPFLGELLVELGMISLEKLFALLELGRGYHELVREGDPKALFGDLAVRKGYVSAVHLFGCLQLQRDEDMAGLPHRPIGEILLDKGYITAWELEHVRVSLVDLELSDLHSGETPAEGTKTKGIDWSAQFPEPMVGGVTGPNVQAPVRAPLRREVVPAHVTAPMAAAPPRIANIMSPVQVTVSPYSRLADARTAAAERGLAHILVIDTDDLVGVLHLAGVAHERGDKFVLRLMHTPVVSVSAHSSVEDAAHCMRENGLDCLPVMVGALLVGVITRADLARAGVLV